MYKIYSDSLFYTASQITLRTFEDIKDVLAKTMNSVLAAMSLKCLLELNGAKKDNLQGC